MIPKLGCVPYLNAKPLLEGLSYPVAGMVPSRLYESYQQGEFDAALLSSVDILSMPYISVVDHVAIASKGNVHSVIMAYSGELKSIKKVHLDPASHTSNVLLKIILREFFNISPEYVQFQTDETSFLSDGAAHLFIGDRAISFRKRTSSESIHLMDLGDEWFRKTGFPFVFAMWALKYDYTNKKYLSDALRNAKMLGLSRRQEIASRTPDPTFSLRYLTEFIHYDLEENEKKGLQLFADYLRKYRFVEPLGNSLVYF